MAGGHAPKRRRTVEVISDSSEDEGIQLGSEGDELARANATLSKVENGLLCGICMELLDRPCVVSPCGHIFCANCLVSWFKVEMHVNEEDEQRGTVRRKKVCPSCRVQVVTPPLELWALKGVLEALRESTNSQRDAPPISQDLWEGLFDPATFYHVIRDEDDGVLRCGVCSSEILEGECSNPECGVIYEDLTEDEASWHRSEAVNHESEEEANDSDEEGSLQDFVVDDDDAASQGDYASSDSGIVSVSPPPDESHRTMSESNTRKSRLDELRAARARRHGNAARIREPSSEESEEIGEADSDTASDAVSDANSDQEQSDDEGVLDYPEAEEASDDYDSE